MIPPGDILRGQRQILACIATLCGVTWRGAGYRPLMTLGGLSRKDFAVGIGLVWRGADGRLIAARSELEAWFIESTLPDPVTLSLRRKGTREIGTQRETRAVATAESAGTSRILHRNFPLQKRKENQHAQSPS